MKVHELLAEEAINVQQDSKKLLKSLGDVCREHDATMELEQSMGASVGKTGSYWSGIFRMKKAAQKKMDVDEQELTLKVLRLDIIKWLKALQAEGRAIGTRPPLNYTSKQSVEMVTDPAELLDRMERDWDGHPCFKGRFFIGIPEGSAPEHVVRVYGYGLRDFDSRREETYHVKGTAVNPPRTDVYVKYDEVPFDLAVGFTDEAETKKVVKALNTALKNNKPQLLKFMLDLVKATGHATKNMGFDKYTPSGSVSVPVNTAAEIDKFVNGFGKDQHVSVKKGIKAKDTIMVDRDMFLQHMKKHGIEVK